MLAFAAGEYGPRHWSMGGASAYSLLERVATIPATLNTLEHNVATGNPGDGFLLEFASQSTLERDRSHHNGRDGIRVEALSTVNRLLVNTMFNNGEHDAHDNNRESNTWAGNYCRTDFPTGTICENGGP